MMMSDLRHDNSVRVTPRDCMCGCVAVSAEQLWRCCRIIGHRPEPGNYPSGYGVSPPSCPFSFSSPATAIRSPNVSVPLEGRLPPPREYGIHDICLCGLVETLQQLPSLSPPQNCSYPLSTLGRLRGFSHSSICYTAHLPDPAV